MEICYRVTVLQSRIQECPHVLECQALPVPAACIYVFLALYHVLLWEAHAVVARFIQCVNTSYMSSPLPFLPCSGSADSMLDSYNVIQSVRIQFSPVFDVVKCTNKENQLGKMRSWCKRRSVLNTV